MNEKQNSDFEDVKHYWINSSDKDYNTMMNLFKSKDYNWSLFIGHIVIERLLKAYYVQTHNGHAPFTHDLLRLSNAAGFEIDNEKSDWLDTITTFNINARYDSYKSEFYNKCTPEFTDFWIKKIEELREWIKSKL